MGYTETPEDKRKWAITYVRYPYPTSVGEVVKFSDKDTVWLKFPYGSEPWDIKHCRFFETEEAAKKEYNDFRRNRNNYAYEG